MKRFAGLALLAGLLSFVGAEAVAAQSVNAAFGITKPTGDFSDFGDGDGDGANVGWMVSVGANIPLGENGLWLGPFGFYGVNNHDHEGDKTNVIGGTAALGYSFGEPDEAGGFVMAGPGLLAHQYAPDTGDNETDTGLSAMGGAGAAFPLGSVRAFIVATYTMGFGDVDGTNFIGGHFGIAIPVGGN